MRKYEDIARLLTSVTFLLLVVIGILNMWSISVKISSPHVFKKHLISSLISVFVFLGAFLLSRRFPKVIPLFGVVVFVVSVLLLILVSLKGKVVFGSKRWISVGGITFQPTEIAKISSVIITAYIFALRRIWRAVLVSAVVNFVPAYLVASQPDFGSASTFIITFISALFFSRFPTRVFAIFVALAFISAPFMWKFGLKEYHRKRITAFLNPERDYLFTGYQTVQARLAIGSGGLVGQGFAKGEHSSGRWIPNLHSDFAFVSIAEDFGFIGVIITITLIFLLILSLLARAFLSEQKFVQNFSAILSVLLASHIVVNILMVVGLFPVVGIPLTFISYGGSHNISMALLLGICTGITEKRRKIQL